MKDDLAGRVAAGEEPTADELEELVRAYHEGRVADDEMAAFLRAVYEHGVSFDATAALTAAEVATGTVIEWPDEARPLVDKHSTGGVGDTVSLVAVPWAASIGVRVPKLSGRSLGHTGGTIDKLASVPGVTVELALEDFVRQVIEVGAAIAEPFGDLCPVEARIYALRDARGLVDSVPLITASILAKKLAAGADAFVFDVKVGSGAFMKTEEEARALAESLVEVARRFGKRCACVLTRMDAPLGSAVGNALEVAEAMACLEGGGSAALREVALAVATEMAVGAGMPPDEAREKLLAALRAGDALDRFVALVAAQGGPKGAREIRASLPQARVKGDFVAGEGGTVVAIDPLAVARAARAAAGGRADDPAAGVVLRVERGARVEEGDVLCEVHATSFETLDAAVDELEEAFVIERVKYRPPEPVIDVVRSP